MEPILTGGYACGAIRYAASLDNPGFYKPQMVVYSQFKQPWDYVGPSLPRP